MTNPVDPEADALARLRFMILNAIRIGSLGAVIAGIAGAQNAIPIPYPLSIALALGGFIGFFFGPPHFAKRFKAADKKEAE